MLVWEYGKLPKTLEKCFRACFYKNYWQRFVYCILNILRNSKKTVALHVSFFRTCWTVHFIFVGFTSISGLFLSLFLIWSYLCHARLSHDIMWKWVTSLFQGCSTGRKARPQDRSLRWWIRPNGPYIQPRILSRNYVCSAWQGVPMASLVWEGKSYQNQF